MYIVYTVRRPSYSSRRASISIPEFYVRLPFHLSPLGDHRCSHDLGRSLSRFSLSVDPFLPFFPFLLALGTQNKNPFALFVASSIRKVQHALHSSTLRGCGSHLLHKSSLSFTC